MATVKDVARLAGVSVGTVSKVLSKNPTVQDALQKRVLLAVADLGYKPNLAARALRTKQVNIIGLVVPDISNPFFAQLAKEVEACAARHGQIVMLANSDDKADAEARQVEALLDQSPRGLIVVGTAYDATINVKTQIPIVSVDRRYGDCQLIATNHQTASALVADHLFGLGHRRIAYISGPQTTDVGRMRMTGFKNRIEELTRDSRDADITIVEGQFDYASGETLARALLMVGQDERPTAIASASDQQAIGALRAARDLGIDVPASLSITGFDDIELAHLVVPRLTSVAQRVDQIASYAVQVILSASEMPHEDKFIPADLIVRGSTAVARPVSV